MLPAYNTNVGDIMRMNSMHADTKLVYGSTIKIHQTKKVKPKYSNHCRQQINVMQIKYSRHLLSRAKLYTVSVNNLMFN